MSAELRYWHKARIRERYILEISIYAVSKSDSYPDGVKYRLIFVDIKSSQRVLMDNHSPKGHHVHLDQLELKYKFIDEFQLVEDFKRMVFEHMEVKL